MVTNLFGYHSKLWTVIRYFFLTDICCGTGTIGLYLAKVHRCYNFVNDRCCSLMWRNITYLKYESSYHLNLPLPPFLFPLPFPSLPLSLSLSLSLSFPLPLCLSLLPSPFLSFSLLSSPFLLPMLQSLSVRKLIGVEMVEQAVDDARVNAALNG